MEKKKSGRGGARPNSGGARPGSGRPPRTGGATVVRSLRFSPAEWADVEAAAEAASTSASAWVRGALFRALSGPVAAWEGARASEDAWAPEREAQAAEQEAERLAPPDDGGDD